MGENVNIFYPGLQGEMNVPQVVPFHKFLEELSYFWIDPSVISDLKRDHGVVDENDMDLPTSPTLQVKYLINTPFSS